MTALAFCYRRFSTVEQVQGDSLRRQTEAAERFCQRHGLELVWLEADQGVSAFKGKHREVSDDGEAKHQLGKFVQRVKTGEIPRGSWLVLEALDRLSREETRTSLRFLLELQDMGVNVGSSMDGKCYRYDDPDFVNLIMATVNLAKAHAESSDKSKRVKASKDNRLTRSRASGEFTTRKVPAWCMGERVDPETGEVREVAIIGKDRRIGANPARAEVIRKIFQLCIEGMGGKAISGELTRQGVRGFGKEAHWCKSYVCSILKDRRVLGERQPYNRDGTPNGPVQVDYYPAIVTEEEFLAARAAARGRAKGAKASRTGKRVNLFCGLMANALAPTHLPEKKDTYYVKRLAARKGRPEYFVFCNQAGDEGRAASRTFPVTPFEGAFGEFLQAIDPREVSEKGSGASTLLGLEGRLLELIEDIEDLKKSMKETRGETRTAAIEALNEKYAEKGQLEQQVTDERLRAMNPAADAWGKVKTLARPWMPYESDDQGGRVRLRAALRNVVEEIRLLVVPKGRTRLAAVQVWFKDSGKARGYILAYSPWRGNARVETPEQCVSRGWPPEFDRLDLRQDEHAREAAEWLANRSPA